MRMIRTVPGPTRPAMIGCRCSFRSNVPWSKSTVFAGMLVGDRGVQVHRAIEVDRRPCRARR